MAKKTNSEEISIKKDTPDSNLKYCFVITPIANIGSDIYLKANGLIDAVINPVLSELGYKVEAAHHINSSGSISNQIIERLLESDLVVANLTGLNPNVMYELAVRHAKRLPVISLAENETKLPFDIQAERTLFYEDSMRGVEDLKPKLKQAVDAIDFDTDNHDNPIYRAAKDIVMQNVLTTDKDQYILKKLDELTLSISQIKNTSRDNWMIKSSKIHNSMYELEIDINDVKIDSLEPIIEMASKLGMNPKIKVLENPDRIVIEDNSKIRLEKLYMEIKLMNLPINYMRIKAN